MTAAVLKRVAARQGLIFAYIDFDYTMLVSGSGVSGIEVPQNAVVFEGSIIVDTAWNSATSDVLSIGDAGSTARYLSAHTIAATGRTAIVPTGFVYTTPTLISLLWTGVGAVPTAGNGTLELAYYVRGRDQFSQGLDYGSRLA